MREEQRTSNRAAEPGQRQRQDLEAQLAASQRPKATIPLTAIADPNREPAKPDSRPYRPQVTTPLHRARLGDPAQND